MGYNASPCIKEVKKEKGKESPIVSKSLKKSIIKNSINKAASTVT